MKSSSGVLEQSHKLLAQNPVRRATFFLLSLVAHIVVLALSVVSWPTARVIVVPPKNQIVQMISGPAHVSFNPSSPKPTRPHTSHLQLRRNLRQRHALQPEPESEGTAMQALRKRAKEYTVGLMSSFKFRHIYGFSPGADYQLAFQTAGSLPLISADEVPPRFEQYLIVDVIVDVDGRVADAHIEGGAVNPAIEQKVLAAIREFKYRPATRDGSPIPCQLGIVVHIPS
jgi:TonB family protein